MQQLLVILLVIVIVPFLAGIGIRYLCRRWPKGWAVTAASAVFTLAAAFEAVNPPVAGSEAYGLRAVQMVCVTLGSLVMGLILRRRKQNETL